MTNKKYDRDCIVGIWKFSHKVNPIDLVELAEKWAEEDQQYVHLYVRQTSKDQHGLGFEYKAYEGVEDNEEQKKIHDRFFEKMTDQLKRQFGNDLAGWDISSRAYIIR